MLMNSNLLKWADESVKKNNFLVPHKKEEKKLFGHISTFANFNCAVYAQ
jgi:hypothetical protein